MGWASKRKIFILTSIFGILFLLLYIPFLFFWYEGPTCFDGKQNGDELGVDCGGSCALLCIEQVKGPVVLFKEVFEVSKQDQVYSVVAYIENQNILSQAKNVSYKFELYSSSGELITERTGRTDIPKNTRFAIFEGNIATSVVPTHVEFLFTSIPRWYDNTDPVPEIQVLQKALQDEETAPRAFATVYNNSLLSFSRVDFVAIVYDENNRPIGASKTFVSPLVRGERKGIAFTWPQPLTSDVVSCTLPIDVMLVIDRSGSMNDDSMIPPQPLTAVKEAAGAFVSQLEGDNVGLVSFATEATVPVEAPLSSNTALVSQKIQDIEIKTPDHEQHTNLADGIKKAIDELGSSRQNSEYQDVIIALTDGLVSRPLKEGDEMYSETYTLSVAKEARLKGMKVYVIGLGGAVDGGFLQQVSSTPSDYYFAPEREDVHSVYAQLAESLCKNRPQVLDIIPQFIVE